MNNLASPEDFVGAGTTETFEPCDPASKEGRRRAELTLLKSQPNSLRQHMMRMPDYADKPVPRIEYQVEGWAPKRAVTVFAGLGGGGKTTLAMALAFSSSLGSPWLGLPTTKAKVMCLLTEDPEEVCHMRAAHIAKSHGLTLADFPDVVLLPLVQRDTALMKFERMGNEFQLTSVHRELSALCREHGINMLVLDALHGLFDGNENDRYHARTFCAMLTELAQEIDGAVILLAHPSKASGQDAKNPLSGSTSWHGGVRSVIHVSDPDSENPDARTITLAKANYGRVGEKIEVTWRDGVFHRDAEPEGGILASIGKSRAERIMLEGLQKAVALNYEPSLSDRARDNYAPKIVASQWGDGLKVEDLARAMNRLIKSGDLKIVTIGPPSKAKTLVVPTSQADAFVAARDGSNCGNSNTSDNVRTMSAVSEADEKGGSNE